MLMQANYAGRKVVAAMSGGLDSGVMIHNLLIAGATVRGVSFVYPAKHNRGETTQASYLADHLAAKFPGRFDRRVVDLTAVFTSFDRKGCALLNPDLPVPEGHYEEESMRATVVPGRNTVFLSVLLGMAESIGFDAVAAGVHAGDHFIYPDCRPEFVYAMNRVAVFATDRKVTVFAPYLAYPKSAIVADGLETGFPFELTRTCYAGGVRACGKCGSCGERLEAFALNNAVDPLVYETRALPAKKG